MTYQDKGLYENSDAAKLLAADMQSYIRERHERFDSRYLGLSGPSSDLEEHVRVKEAIVEATIRSRGL